MSHKHKAHTDAIAAAYLAECERLGVADDPNYGLHNQALHHSSVYTLFDLAAKPTPESRAEGHARLVRTLVLIRQTCEHFNQRAFVAGVELDPLCTAAAWEIQDVLDTHAIQGGES